ncbi:MAG: glycoside hydrolase family 97 N-terminal domain-containing protein, partial [Planctomycetota bacterium]
MNNQKKCRHFKALISLRHIFCITLTLMFLNFINIEPVKGAQVVESPDGNVVITFDVRDIGGQRGCLIYSLTYKNQPIVIDSRLGLAMKNAPDMEAGFDIFSVTSSSNNSTYSPVYGERKTIRDHYNQLVVELKESTPPQRRLQLIFRAYNEGAAFCYTLPQQKAMKSFTILAEKTQFAFSNDHTAYAAYSAQGEYNRIPLSKIKNNCERPLTIKINHDPLVSVAEARLVDYARMRLSPDKNQPFTLISSLTSEVKADTPYTTPWRLLILGETPGQLLERNYLILNLNEPCAIDD